METTPKEIDSLAASALCDGDAAALAKLVAVFTPRLYGFFRQAGVPGSDREDLIQQTWLNAVRNPSSFCKRRRGFEAWFVTIARNVRIDWWRRATHRPKPMDLADVESQVDDRLPIDWLFALERAPKLKKCMESLSKRDRQIIVLRWWEELSFKEIARRIDDEEKEASVRAIHDRAMRRLRICMGLAPAPKKNAETRERREDPPVFPSDGDEPADAGREGRDDE